MKCLFGVETEYGLIDLSSSGPKSPTTLAEVLFRQASQDLMGVGSRRTNMFLASGARFYLDSGAHPEWCSAECTNPDDLVNQVRAGEQHLVALLRTAAPSAAVVRANIHYGLEPATWGCHESHAYQGPREALSSVLIAHYVSRVIFAGAGGIDPTHPGVRFSLSPRAMLFSSRTSTSRVISIDDTRDEPLAAQPWHRLHIVLGDTLCLDHALWLRVASTALLVSLAASGRITGRECPQLSHPVDALRDISTDPTLSQHVRMLEGGGQTALAIQRRYLELAQRELEVGDLPDWASEACTRWEATLDALTRGPAYAVGLCDWALKYELFTRRLRREGTDWAELTDLYRQGRVEFGSRERCRTPDEMSCEIDRLMARRGAPIEPLPMSGPHEAIRRRLRMLRHTLAEMDVRFGLRPGGVAEALEPEMLASLPGVTESSIRHAMNRPPTDTRAAARGEAIRRRQKSRQHLRSDWDRVIDMRRREELHLPDPFSTDLRWRSSEVRPPRRNRTDDVDHQLFDLVSELYNRGDYRKLLRCLKNAFDRYGDSEWVATRLYPYEAWARSRTGDVAAARRALRRLRSCDDQDYCLKQLSVHRFQGLCPNGPRTWRWIRRCNQAERSRWHNSSTVTYLGHKGYFLSRQGRLEEAIEVLQRSLRLPLVASNHLRLSARNQCDLADCLRVVGREEEAATHLADARQTLTRFEYEGELADHWMLVSAKLVDEQDWRIDLLTRARRIQHRMGNPIGALRSTLLLARITDRRVQQRHARSAAQKMRREIPDLRHCPRLKSILTQWRRWTDDPDPCPHGDPFWLL